MNENNILEAMKTIALDILGVFKAIAKSDIGVNRKVGKNTLKNSRLVRTAAIDVDDNLIKLILNDYIDYVESGRRKKAMLVPIEVLRNWAQRNGIKSDNQTLANIQYGIWRDGIKGRPIMSSFFQMLDKKWNDTYSNVLFEGIINEIEKIFNE